MLYFREHGTSETPPADLRVGLMTYDSRIHLYDLSPALSRPHMLVVTETDDLQLPVRDGLLVSLRDCMDSIDRYPPPPHTRGDVGLKSSEHFRSS